jgi:hypothetical protein
LAAFLLAAKDALVPHGTDVSTAPQEHCDSFFGIADNPHNIKHEVSILDEAHLMQAPSERIYKRLIVLIGG